MPIPAMVLDPVGLPALPNGLIEASVGPLDLPAHASTSGATYLSDSCGEGRLYPAACQDVPYPTMVMDTNDGAIPVYVFNVYSSIACGTYGQTFEDAQRRVRARLQMSEARAVELAFWGGSAPVLGVLQQLNTAGQVTTLADAANVVEAVSLLEQQMASVYGGLPLIHARPRMGAYLSDRGQIEEHRPPRTAWGSRFVFGAGYAGNGPDGTAVDATSEFMVATGRVLMWRGEVWTPPSIQMVNRTTNQLGLWAIRTYAIAVECGVAAVQVTRA